MTAYSESKPRATLSRKPADKRRVAVISNGAFALTNFRGPLIEEMVRNGAKVFALAPDFCMRERAKVAALGATPIDYALDRSGVRPLREIGSIFRLWVTLRRLRVDTVLACFIKPAIYGILAAWYAGVPHRHAMIEGLGYAFTHDETGSMRRRILSRAVAEFLRMGLRRAHTVFFLNDDDQQLFLERGLARPETAVRIHGIGVELDRFHPAPPVREPVTFIMVARLLREKGVGEFVEAARRLRPEYPSARFVLVGGLDSNPGAIDRATAKSWHATGTVEWLGHIESVIDQLERASVFVLPSWREGAPRSTQEAMALARPVITTDAPGARDTVVEGHNGFLVPPRDALALAEAMRRFLDDPSLIEPMGRASRALAEQRYDVKNINALILGRMGFAGG